MSSFISEIIANVDSFLEMRWEDTLENGLNLTYLGYALPGSSESSSSWMIKKIIYTSPSAGKILFAENNAKYEYSWSNRHNYIYGI